MKADISWDDEAKTIMRYTYSGIWNWDDFYRILEWNKREPLDRNVIILVDFRDITRFPSDAILHLKRAAKMADATQELIILITTSSSLVTLFNIFVKMYSSIGKRFRIVASDEEAYAILKRSREKANP